MICIFISGAPWHGVAMDPRRTLPRAAALAGLACLLLGCGEARDGEPVTKVGAEYLVKTRVFDNDTTTGYVTFTDSLDEPPDYDRALEIAGGGVLYAAPGIGNFMIGSGEEPVITRCEIDGDGKFSRGPQLSFANEGVIYLYAGSVNFVSPHKAYYIDLDQLQAIAFDPTEMVVTNTVSLEGASREGFFTSFGDAVVRPDGVYFPGEWYTEPDWDRVPSGSLLVRLDPETDEATFTSDPRCTSMLLSMTNDAGDTYFFSDMFNTFARRGYGPENGVPDCALRLKAGERAFDPDWQLDINSRTGGAPAVAVLPGGGSKIWLRVLDEDAAELPSPADYQTLDTAPAWQWHLLDVESDEPAVRNDERPLSSVGAIGMNAGGRAFTTIENEDYSETILLELTPDGFVEHAKYPGVVDEIVRLR